MSTNSQLLSEIKRLKQEKNAVILVHNYQELEVQDAADFLGDSLQLAQEAAKTSAAMILLCGVQFMAETAKLLNPNSKVFLAHKDAGCPMANMITGEQLIEFKKDFPNSAVVCYVNSTVEVKAESYICCTSSNAVKIVKSLPADQKILFVPDQNLGTYTAEQSGREVIVWKGFCNVHHQKITVEDVKIAREKYPDYTLIVHPECKPEVFHQADLVTSTKGMADFVANNDKIILGTEIGLYQQLKRKYPEKKIVPLSEKAVCVNMKKTTLSDVYNVLKNEVNEIIIDKDISERAMLSLTRMLSV